MSLHRPHRLMLACLVGLCCAAISAQARAEDLRWDRLADGLFVTSWTPGTRCRQDVSSLSIVKVDPDRFRFSVYFYRDDKLAYPPAIDEWLRRTRAAVIVNAGLFQPDFSYLGILMKGGRRLGGRRHARWKGLFVAEPTASGERKARVLDLSVDHFSEEQPAFEEAAQSLMLFDRTGRPRVRRSDHRAQQTVVAEDRDGKILIIKTSEETALWDLAQCLQQERPELSHAMAMDGGSSSDVVVDPAMATAWAGAQMPPPWYGLVDTGDRPHIPLPAVIGVFPREPG